MKRSNRSNTILGLVGFLLIVILFFLMVNYRDTPFETRGKLVSTKILKVDACPKVGYCIEYQYNFDGKLYRGNGTHSPSGRGEKIGNILAYDAPILAVIDSINPSDSRLLLTIADYESLNIAVPDSAQWILKLDL